MDVDVVVALGHSHGPKEGWQDWHRISSAI